MALECSTLIRSQSLSCGLCKVKVFELFYKNEWIPIVESIMEVKRVIMVLYIEYKLVEIVMRRH